MAESSPLDCSNHPPPVFDLPCDPLAPRPYDDFDLDLHIDWDFSVDDFLLSPDNQPSHAPDDPPDSFAGGGSGNEFSTSSPPHHQSFDFPHQSKGSHPASPDSGNSSQESGVMDKDVKVEAVRILKRKTDRVEGWSDATFNKLQRSIVTENEEEDKKKERMMRNRESAQLSRQRKKKYVEELEDKVKSMQSMINQLNANISYVMAENTALRQQLGGGSGTLPAVYPPMHLPWLPGYGWRPKGSQVPLVPIPKLKPQQSASAKTKKTGSKTKKVASVSLLGLLLFVVVVCGLVPEIHLWYRGTRNEIDIIERRTLNGSIGKVLDISGRNSGQLSTNEVGLSTRSTRLEKDGSRIFQVHNGGPLPSTGSNSNAARQNSSDTLPALLYVPRNGKLVKIDGNLIIHSVLAGEKAMAQAKDKCSAKESKGTSLAVAGNTMSALAVPNFESEVDRSLPENRYGNNFKETSVDGPLSQWFREGMAGPILNSGMCTEVFQFDISPSSSSGIIPTTSIVNATSMDNASENFPSAPGLQTAIKSRRMKYTEPAPLSATVPNDTQQFRKPSEGSNFGGDKPVSSIVVSVLADPKEAGIGDGDGMISPKSISRIFVVVLLDSVKYVTYSCVLPFKTSVPVL